MKKILLLATLWLTSVLTALSTPVDLTQIDGKIWNPRGTYLTGTDNETWNLNQFGNSGINFVLREGSNFAPSGYESVFNVNSPSSQELNAWLCSPAFLFKKGYTYQIKFSYRYTSSSTRISMSCWIDDAKGTLDAETATAMTKKKAMAKNNGYPTSWTEISFDYTPDEEGVRFINYQALTSQYASSTGLLYVGQFEVKIVSSQAQPQAPSDVTAEPAPDGKISATLSWILPTHNVGGEPLTGNNAIQNMLVYRDGENVATLPGSAVSWTDTEASGLSKGTHYYQIAAVAADETGVLSEPTPSIYVGPYLYAPLTMEFADDQWTCYKIAGQAFSSNAAYVEPPYTNAASIWAYNQVQEDAWLCSPPLKLDPAKTYKVRFNYLTWDDTAFIVEHLNIYASGHRADENTVGSILETEPIYTLDNIKHSMPTWKSVEISGVKGIGEATHILFHVSGKVCKRFSINAFEVEEYTEVPFAPAAPTSLTARVAPYQQELVNLSWTNPTTSSDGSTLTEDQPVTAVRILRDNEVVFTSDKALTEFTDSPEYGLTAGTHEYAVAVCAANAWSMPSESVTTGYVGAPDPQSLPWKPQLAALTSDVFDRWWVSYPADGTVKWLAGATGIRFVNTTGTSENCWLIGAPLDLDSRSTSYKLNYRMNSEDTTGTKISIGLTDTAMPEDFTFLITENAVFGEDQSVRFTLDPTRAASMPRIAFRATSPSGTRTVTLSLLELATDDQTGIDDVSVSGISDIRVFNLNGQIIGQASSLSLEGFSRGIYVVTYISEGKTLRMKIIK